MRDPADHPCFSLEARGRAARIHLPVAPACNVQCNFCSRKYDCVNESRPGVTSAVLTPTQALDYLKGQCAARDDIRVVGIAGPGDALATPDRTLETLRLVRGAFPDMLLCVATNGLALPDWIDDLLDVGVSHLTVTVNAVDPDIAARIYAWVRAGGENLKGLDAARAVIDAQERAIRRLADTDVLVKVNHIVIPGVNDAHTLDVARAVRAWGADRMNCMPLKPTADTAFADVAEPDEATIGALRCAAAEIVPQMTHCTRCRSDACGKLGEDNPAAMQTLAACAAEPAPYAAVASRDGYFVNVHLGEAEELLIYKPDGEDFTLVDVRPMPAPGGGVERWRRAADLVRDCRAVVVGAAGPAAIGGMSDAGARVIEAEGLIADVLERVFSGEELPPSLKRRATACGVGCTGNGGGCG